MTFVLLLLFVGLPVLAIGALVSHAKKQEAQRQRKESLDCARFVWRTATMGEDGVIRVNMATEDKWRAENPGWDTFHREFLAATFRAGR